MGTLPDEATDLVDLTDFLNPVSTEDFQKEISPLRSDQIPVKYVKQVGDFFTGPLAHNYHQRVYL